MITDVFSRIQILPIISVDVFLHLRTSLRTQVPTEGKIIQHYLIIVIIVSQYFLFMNENASFLEGMITIIPMKVCSISETKVLYFFQYLWDKSLLFFAMFLIFSTKDLSYTFFQCYFEKFFFPDKYLLGIFWVVFLCLPSSQQYSSVPQTTKKRVKSMKFWKGNSVY